ncbi:type I phosphodiesterase/nucleotide pyrophosphatase [Chloroherpeton thalassium ATCC 35110]|uniref:Type I phosphodiesterase/nucleotide pyrophosphatase n=1 Tax=Chloroherpeton thalassium (strain ATCC 35110 / GB-78) TaxID=517418 RepID=B3QS65_CHLT3|nr:alkaline phosphatase family protein [Chloroherpeton thalassium]ACF14010.1 type I phosphodiesterase/nucleotide pyrophosphatase [Chloroherpeton thalassium ATCC 35110]
MRKSVLFTALRFTFLLTFLVCQSFLLPKFLVAQTDQPKQKPKLILTIVIDQFRYDYLDRFEDMFLPVGKHSGGFRKLRKQGAFMEKCFYDHSATNTGPGHATILTGMYPSHSGIVTNKWRERESGELIYCVSDEKASPVGKASSKSAGKRSPANLLVNTVGDRLKISHPQSKIISVALKDRAAILLGGHKPNAAYWFDAGSGKWISSSYYFPQQQLPKWLVDFNDKNIAESYLGKEWRKLLPDKFYPMADDVYGEGFIPGEQQRTFPHTIHDLSKIKDPRLRNSNRFDALLVSPYGHAMTTAIAKEIIENEALGQDSATDVLAVSYSSLDYCGHTFGPMSQEVQDVVIRLDRQLDDLLGFVDKKIGLENCVVVLTADHGVSPLPEFMDNGKRLREEDVLDSLKFLVESRYPNLIEYFSGNEIYLNTKLIEEKEWFPAEMEDFVAKNAEKLSFVAHAFTRAELILGNSEQFGRMASHSFNKQRSGDVYLIYKPYMIFAGQTGTTHGSPYDYDSHVPLFFFGKKIRPGAYTEKCTPADIAPTLHHILRLSNEVHPPYDGRVLNEVLSQ